MVAVGFDIGISATAFLAAYFWFASTGTLPPMLTYWTKTPPHDPYRMAVEKSARMNRLGALFAGCSAGLSGVKVALQVAGLI